jgi:hypothetical protein
MDRRGSRGPQEARSSGKEREPHRCGSGRGVQKCGYRQGEPDGGQTRRRRARPGNTQGAPESTSMGECSVHSAQRPPLRPRPRWRSPGRAGGGEDGVGAWRSRDWRDATATVRGHSRIRLSLAAWRSKKRGVRLLRAYAGQGPVLLRRPLSHGVSPASGEAERARAARAPGNRQFLAAVLRAGYVRWNTQIRPGASAFASRRVDADWMRRGRKLASLAVAST